MLIFYLDILALELELKRIVYEVQVAINPGNLLANHPILVEQFDEDISQQDLALLFILLIKVDPFVDGLLISG